MKYDLAIIGRGPAGALLASRAVQRGFSVINYDRIDFIPWNKTLGVWEYQIPSWLDVSSHHTLRPWVSFPGTSTVPLRSALDNNYTILNNYALYSYALQHAPTYETRSITLDELHTIAHYAIDARGIQPTTQSLYQSAYGIIVSPEVGTPLLPSGIHSGYLMDWSQSFYPDRLKYPSFAYIMPLTENRILIEETVLLSPHPIAQQLLIERLQYRLMATQVITSPQSLEEIALETEHVCFPTTPNHIHKFGSAGMNMHPATGYSVGSSLERIDPLLDEYATHMDSLSIPSVKRLPEVQVTSSHNHSVKLPSLATLPLQLALFLRLWCALTQLRLETQLPQFLYHFFNLPQQKQHYFLTQSHQLVPLARSMVALFVELPWKYRCICITSGWSVFLHATRHRYLQFKKKMTGYNVRIGKPSCK